MTDTYTATQLTAARLHEAASIAEEIENLRAQLAAILNPENNGRPSTTLCRNRKTAAQSKRKGISAAGRERIRQAQLKRWAKTKKAKKAKSKGRR